MFGVLNRRGMNSWTTLWELFRGRSEIWTGYRVAIDDTVRALEDASPEAAQWWRDNTPHIFQPGGALLFPTDVCRVIG